MFKGIVLSVMASVTFGILYFYTGLLGNLDSQQTFGWRMLLTLPFLSLFMWWSGDFIQVRRIFQRLLAHPGFLLLLILSSVLTSIQLWLFLWGPMNGRGLQVSLGYFLLPLMLVLAGSCIYGEKLSRFQWAAVLLAVTGVGHEIWRQGSIAWETIMVAVGYTGYFLLRRQLKTDHLGGFWWDIMIILPVAVYFILAGHSIPAQFAGQPVMPLVLMGLGLLSAIGLGSYMLASRHLPLVLFGLLGYLEPVLLVLAALALGERISSTEWLTYIPIWGAVALLIAEGGWHLYQQRCKKQQLIRNMLRIEDRLKNKN
ncbi:EamA family transporter RarD [Acinetobacter sp. WZC-1]|uniref:EamA family transporter RarD n=1 Tax=Acinetobacter sp. WZC-1 TaxID=3459034 RepID=UPI00403E34E6